MECEPIEKQFSRMGARLSTGLFFRRERVRRQYARGEVVARRNWISVDRPASGYSLDIRHERRGDRFDLRLSDDHEALVLDVQPRQRHLLLMINRPDGTKDKFLCGHDERAWFVAAVPGAASTVRTAMEALKPAEVINRAASVPVRAKNRNRRRNKVFLRQGEWFFVPCRTDIRPEPRLVLHNEPIRRGRGKPHVCEWVYREKGEVVWVCRTYPNGLTDDQYRRLLLNDPGARNWRWERRMRNARVFAKGRVRHPDHKTVELAGWHEVHPNREHQTRAMEHLAFID